MKAWLKGAILLGICLGNIEAKELQELLLSSQNSSRMEAKERAIQSARLQEEALFAGYLPKASLGYDHQRLSKASAYTPTRVNRGYGEVSVVIFDGLAREERLEQFERLKQARIHEANFERENLALEIIEKYFSYHYTQSLLQSALQKDRELSESLRRSKILYDSELIPLDEPSALEAALEQNRYEIEAYRLHLFRYQQQLELLSGSPLESLQANSRLKEPTGGESGILREDLRAREEEVNALEHQAKTHTYWPTLSAKNSYSHYDFNSYLGEGTPSAQPERQNEFLLSAKMDIFDFGAIAKERESVRMQKLKAQSELNYAKESLQKEQKIALFTLQVLKQQLKAAQLSLKASSTALEIQRQKFSAQLLSHTDYLAALSQEFEAKAKLQTALNEYEIAKARFYFALGAPLFEQITLENRP